MASYIVVYYSLYFFLTVIVTVYVATTLFKNGRMFLIDIFHGDQPLADSVNKLLLVGFYLINIGYAVYTLSITGEVETVRLLIERLSVKLGGIILILGGMHFFNLYVFYSLRKKAKMYDREKLYYARVENKGVQQ
ncbi:MAG: hypothetical protein IPP29_20060 [Bacteroidetes bacterium]|nr:hypothetical protein [Bacteroidota bacterium]MBL0053621.1 hypothetical protein [Bacteroidota bacterium]